MNKEPGASRSDLIDPVCEAVEVFDFDGQNLQIGYHGACGSCPSVQAPRRSPQLHGWDPEVEEDSEIRVMSSFGKLAYVAPRGHLVGPSPLGK